MCSATNESYQEAYEYVVSEVKPYVDRYYQYFLDKGKDLPLTADDGITELSTLDKIDILVKKKYINGTYISDLMLIIDYYVRGIPFIIPLKNYQMRIEIFLENY